MATKVTHPRVLADSLAAWGALTDRHEALYEESEQIRQDIADMDGLIERAIEHKTTLQNRLATATVRRDASSEALGACYEQTTAIAQRHGYKDAQDAENAARGITPWIIG